MNNRIRMYHSNFQPVTENERVPAESINAVVVLDASGNVIGRASKINSLWAWTDTRTGHSESVGDSRTPVEQSLGQVITALSKLSRSR